MEQTRPLSKVCDAADFFTQEYIETVRTELCEAPALRRKQWEFAMILLALKKQGMLEGHRVGLSMGSGNETVLYSIARHVRHLTATDLYNSTSTWEGAKATDPVEHIRKSKPFPVDDSRLSALHMDMRALAFDDGAFDFAYSSCALEHIGEDADFLRHLNEVYRVLKDGGVYVLTTEFTFDEHTIPIKNNYLFSAGHLARLLAESRFEPEAHFDARIAEQSANFPIPGQVDDLFYDGENRFAAALVSVGAIPHVQLLYGKHPFTSCIFVLRKSAATRGRTAIQFDGLAESHTFLHTCIQRYRTMIQADLSLNPFSFLQGRVSSYYAPHRISAGHGVNGGANTIFHTNYYWFGIGVRRVFVTLVRQGGEPEGACTVELRVHRFRTNDPMVVDCCYNSAVAIPAAQQLQSEFALVAEDDYAYAILATMQQGSGLFSSIKVSVLPFERTALSPMGEATTSGGKTPSFFRKLRNSVSMHTPEQVKRIYRRIRRRISL